VAVTVSMADAVAVSVKQNEPDNVDNEPGDADIQHPVCVLDLVLVCQSLNRFNEDREAKRNKEDGIDKCTQHLGPCPAIRVLVRIHL